MYSASSSLKAFMGLPAWLYNVPSMVSIHARASCDKEAELRPYRGHHVSIHARASCDSRTAMSCWLNIACTTTCFFISSFTYTTLSTPQDRYYRWKRFALSNDCPKTVNTFCSHIVCFPIFCQTKLIYSSQFSDNGTQSLLIRHPGSYSVLKLFYSMGRYEIVTFNHSVHHRILMLA